jgi:hypothetical protein
MNKINNLVNVLIFPSGTGVSKEIFDSLKFIRWINVYGADSDENNFSFYQFKNFIKDTPFIKDEEKLITFLKNIIAEKNIDCIYPAFDSIINFLKKHEDNLGVKIIASDLNICDICISKKKTYDMFKDIILTPTIYNYKGGCDGGGCGDGCGGGGCGDRGRGGSNITFPLFIKPECGYGSRDSHKINNIDEYNFYTKTIKDYIACEYLPGDEFTVDCFSSKKNGLLFAEARTRKKVLNGMSVLTNSVNIPEAKEIAQKIYDKLNFVGAWFFQIKLNKDNKYTLLEIAPRIPGAMSLYRNVGINFPLLTICEYYDYSVDNLLINKYDISCYKYFENRYKISLEYDVAYIDLDDTIIIKNKVNTKIMQYIYHLKNMNKPIILITKNADPVSYLKKYFIDINLFDKIIKCEKTDEKINFINLSDKCIFIDDSYVERKGVFEKNINVFNVDMIECLFDEKL